MTDTGATTRPRVAVHEAAHAIAVYVQGGTLTYVNTTGHPSHGNGFISWQEHSIGCVACDPIAAAIVALAGPAAEIYSDDAPVSVNDGDEQRFRRRIGQIAHSALEASALETWLRIHTRELVATRKFRCLLDALVPVLLENGDLDGETATAVLERAEREFEHDEGIPCPSSAHEDADSPVRLKEN